ncbi:MAG TPA: redoxin domain-containing protein [Anaerolineae bacterium]
MNTRSKVLPGLLAVVGGIVLLGVIFASLQGSVSPPPVPAATSGASSAPPLDPNTVAVVNGDPITRQEWQQTTALERLLNQFAGQPLPDAEATLDRLISERLVLALAGSDRPQIADADAAQRLAQLQQQWAIDDAGLDRALSSIGLSRDDLLSEIKRLLAIEAYLNQIAATQDPNQWLAAQRARAQIGVYTDLAALSPTVSAPSATPTPPPALATGINVGELAPDFTLNDLDGSPVRLSQFRGKAVVLNFWATWCPPCRIEAPALQASYTRYRDREVVVLGVDAQEDAATVRGFASEFGLQYPLVRDTDNSIAAQYQVVGIPTTVILDSEGVVRARHVGPLTEQQFAAYVDPLITVASATPSVAANLAPDFSLPRENGETVTLGDYRGKSSVVIVFYRGSS